MISQPIRELLCAAAVGLALLTGCAADGPTARTPVPTETATAQTQVRTLPLGKVDLTLDAGRYRSPVGFDPVLTMELAERWTSVHRYADAFDLAVAGADGSVSVVIAVLTPPERDAAAALSGIRTRSSGVVEQVSGVVAGRPATGIDITGGTGEIVASADDSIAIDAAPGQLTRVLALDIDGKPLVIVVFAPDADRWNQAAAVAEPLLAAMAAA